MILDSIRLHLFFCRGEEVCEEALPRLPHGGRLQIASADQERRLQRLVRRRLLQSGQSEAETTKADLRRCRPDCETHGGADHQEVRLPNTVHRVVEQRLSVDDVVAVNRAEPSLLLLAVVSDCRVSSSASAPPKFQ